MSDETDPKIVNRLSKIPPFLDAEGNVTGKPQIDEEAATDEAPVEPPEPEEPEEPQETPEPEANEDDALKNSKNPERTKKYIDKLKTEVKEAKKNVLDSLMPDNPVVPSFPEPQYPLPPITNQVPIAGQFPGLTQTQVNETFKGLVDENGYVDAGLLKDTLQGLQSSLAEERKKRENAEQNTQKLGRQFDDFQRNQVMKDVHKEFPMVDPENENFDERMWKYVRNEVVDQWMKGKPTDVMSAARDAHELFYGMKKSEKEEIKKTETAKKNINALGAKPASQRENYADHDQLVAATQRGERGALAERLRRSGF